MRRELLAAFGVCAGIASTCLAADETGAPAFKTALRIAPKVRSEHCRERPFYTVKVLKNVAGDIGGYVLLPPIRDSLIPYLDAEGDALASFHIFASDEEKRKAMAIITPLRRQFPVEETLDCTAE